LDSKDLTAFVEDLKRQWMATVDALVDPLLIVGDDYKIQKANRAMAKHGGVEVRSVVGKKCFEVFAGRSSPCPNCKMKAAAKDSRVESFTLDNIRGDRFYEVTSQPIFAKDGSVEAVVQVYQDRTDKRRLEEVSAQREKLASIGLLAGGVAHEINNPIGGILVFSQMLLKELPKEDPHYVDVQEIENAAQRCKSIVDSLLDFARQKPGEKSSQAVTFDPEEAAKSALRLARIHPKARNCDVNETWLGEGHMIKGDRNKLTQLFVNLMQNAFQAMPDGGTLSLASFTEGNSIVFTVEDTGIGIPPEIIKRIFDPFFTTKDPGEGTGLGLAICYRIAHDLGGEISVESTVNVGTTFRVTLPIHQN